MSEAQDILSGEKVVEGKDKEPDVKPDKDAIEKEAVKEDSVDEVIPLPSPDNLNQELAEAETGKEEFVKDSSEDGENVDPFSEANINDEEDPLANETPSRKVLPPPSADELSDEVLKLREELSASQNESEMEGKEFSLLKDKLSDCLVATICPVGKKIKELIDDKRYLEQVLNKGREKALKKAEENLKKIREIVGLL